MLVCTPLAVSSAKASVSLDSALPFPSSCWFPGGHEGEGRGEGGSTNEGCGWVGRHVHRSYQMQTNSGE